LRDVSAGLGQGKFHRPVTGAEKTANEVAALAHDPMTVTVGSNKKVVGRRSAMWRERVHGGAVAVSTAPQ
jgi:hypothetical protein